MIDLSPVKQELAGKPVAVYGLGKSGLSAVRALQAAGVTCHVWDSSENQCLEAEKLGGLIYDLDKQDMSAYGYLILAPGIPLYHPEPPPAVSNALESGVEIIGDIELFHKSKADARVIAITGTNGKSTTTALIGHILKTAGIPCSVGGNIGVPVLDMDIPEEQNSWVILETSSFQLDLCKEFRPDIGVLINITTDHLDRHGGMENYVIAKKRLFQNGFDAAVIGVDNKATKDIFREFNNKEEKSGAVIPISVLKELDRGVYIHDEHLIDSHFHEEPHEFLKLSPLRKLPGHHNWQNICMAYTVCRHMGLSPEKIKEGIESFEGLPHRQYLIRVINGIAYVNDSKATNIDSAKRALACYKKIYWILGGRPKSDGLSGAEEYQDRIKKTFLIGEASDEFASWLDNRDIPYVMCGTLDKAVSEAHDQAQSERGEPGGAGTVLFSPACASFDQYKSFEERGEHFVKLVENLEDDPSSDG